MTGWMADGADQWGGRPVARTVAVAGARQRVRLSGVLRSVRAHRPSVEGGANGPIPGHHALVPRQPSSAIWLEAELDDGTGDIFLRWTGRWAIPGIGPGALIEMEGTALAEGHRLVVLNPLYRLEDVGGHQRPATSAPPRPAGR